MGSGRDRDRKPTLKSQAVLVENAKGVIYDGPVQIHTFSPKVGISVDKRDAYVAMEDIFG